MTFKNLQAELFNAWQERNQLPDGSEEQDLMKRAINASEFYTSISERAIICLVDCYLMYGNQKNQSLLQFAKAVAKGNFKP